MFELVTSQKTPIVFTHYIDFKDIYLNFKRLQFRLTNINFYLIRLFKM